MTTWPRWIQKLESPTIEGGKRLNAKINDGTEYSPLISYVTVVRNNVKTLERTILSVKEQTYKNTEHIIIDGASTDGTLELILKYKDELDYYASEPDNGLYDALNKAIPLCRGELILVLNSDDWLSTNSAEYASKNYLFDKAQLICGTAKVLINEKDFVEWKPQKVSLTSYFTVANLNHNAVYASRKAYEKSGPYDSSYMIAADTKWILSCYDSGSNFTYTDNILVNYSLGGISSDIYWHMEECKRIIKEKFKFLKGDEVTALHYMYYQWREGFKYPLIGFDAKLEIAKLLEKYSDKKEFINAIDINSEFFTQDIIVSEANNIDTNIEDENIECIKKVLNKYPFLYNISKKIYHFVKR